MDHSEQIRSAYGANTHTCAMVRKGLFFTHGPKIFTVKTIILWCFLAFASLGCSSDTFSVIVAGHMYPIHLGKFDANLRIFAQQINTIKNGKGLFLVGDNVFTPQMKDYTFLNKHLLSKVDMPFFMTGANHEIRGLGDLQQFTQKKLNNSVVIENNKFILFSLWKQPKVLGQSGLLKLAQRDLDFLRTELTNSDIYDNTFLFTTDALYQDAGWQRYIMPLIKDKVRYVVVGDSEYYGYQYNWHEQDNIIYLHVGFGEHYNFPFLEIQISKSGSINIEPHFLALNGLHEYYRQKSFAKTRHLL